MKPNKSELMEVDLYHNSNACALHRNRRTLEKGKVKE